MEVAPPFEQILITHAQGTIFVQYLRILLRSFGEDFPYIHIQSSAKMPVGGVSA